MDGKQTAVIAAMAMAGAATTLLTAAGPAGAQDGGGGLVGEVRLGTREFQDVSAAIAAGYTSSGSCVSGPELGAMGVHYPNAALVGDGVLDARRPEILIYEHRGGKVRLVGVEFLVIAQQWHAANAGPPVLLGQHFQYVSSPNRYGLPPFYELHVWAWRENPKGMFVDWNPAVSCEDYDGSAR